MNKDLNISIFGLDDDYEAIEFMEMILKNAGIYNYKFFDAEHEFLESFHDNVHVAIIDHYVNGEARGFAIMDKIFAYNKTRSLINCRVIIISGQKDYKTVKTYLNKGASGYIDKDDHDFKESLVEYVTREVDEVTKILTFIKRQEQFVAENTIRIER